MAIARAAGLCQRHRNSLLTTMLLAVSGSFATPVHARPQPPLTINSVTRTQWVIADADPNDHAEQLDDFAETGQYMDNFSVFAVGDEGANADADSSQDTNTTQYTFSGSGNVSAGGFGSTDFYSYSYVNNRISVDFTTAEATIFYLRYRLDADSSNTNGSAAARVHFFGPKDGGNFFLEIEQSDNANSYEPVDGVIIGVLAAGADCDLTVELTASGSGYDDGFFITSAEFEFDFTILDTDLDGLLDIWEDEQGVDVKGDKTKYAPLPGADKNHKDLFVEYEVVQGVTLIADALDDVKQAFAAVPFGLIDNPDTNDGVTLHFIPGGDNPAGGVWTNEAASFAMVKAQSIGTAAERNDTEYNTVFRDARIMTHRFLVFADSEPGGSTGLAERPGDDAIVYLGTLNTLPLADQRNAIAGTTMHELGHTLGFGHGGVDSVNFKPNYMSVMNYPLQIPYQGDPTIWRLNYSGATLLELDEMNLNEAQGIGAISGEYVNWHTFWNATEYNPVTPAAPFLTHDPAFGAIDWNGDGDPISSGLRMDLNNLVDLNEPMNSPLRPFAAAPSPDEKLAGYCDWCNMQLPHKGATGFRIGTTGLREDSTMRDAETEPPLTSLVALVNLINGVEPQYCRADLNFDDVVSGEDLAAVLAAWMTDNPDVDFNEDGVVQGEDLAFVLAAWGACP